MNQEFYQELMNTIAEKNIRTDEPMKDHTTFRAGGPAAYFIIPESKEEVRDSIAICRKHKIPFYIMGNGSNLLVSDRGYDGAVIQIFKAMNQIEVKGNQVTAQAGALLSAIASQALLNSLTGFEFAAGIPGTLGGACVMNAGAYGGEMKDVLHCVTALTQDGEILTLKKEELELGYRTSIIAREGYIVLEAVLMLAPGREEEIRARMEELKEKRTAKQPLEYPSAGSTFKRPQGYFAGKLIQDAGLRGFRVGGAEVSEKHCGFVINRDHASAADIKNLMDQVIQKVKDNSGVTLEPEVKRLGEF